MKTQRVRTIRLLFLLICGAILAIIIGTYAPESEATQAYKQYALLEKARLDSYQLDTERLNEREIAIQGVDFTISNEYIDCYVDELVTLNEYDTDEAIQYAITTTIARYAQFYKACDEGFLISEDALDEVIQINVESMKNSRSQDQSVDAFLTTIDRTVEAYWEQMRDELRMTETVGRYKHAIQKACSSSDTPYGGDASAYEPAWETITQQAIDAQNIEIFYQEN